MSIRVALHHKTGYIYDRPVKLSPQIIRLRPAPHCRTPILSYSLNVEPKPHFLNWQQDPQSNHLARAVFPDPVQEFVVEVDLVADLTIINPFDFFLEPNAEEYPFQYDAWLEEELAPFLKLPQAGPLLFEYLKTIDLGRRRTVLFLVDLNARLQSEISYVIRLEPGVQTAEETLGQRTGSCRDSAFLLLQILRHLGFAARFVSGYLIQLKPDVMSLDGPVGASHDFTDLHAWTEVYLPGAGWIGLDPTSGLLAGEGHLPVAATPEPMSAAPITGLVEPCEVQFRHEMTVTRIHEDPRVTKPYTDQQWAKIDALGRHIDEELWRGDVKLTMGGEPTFVGVDNVDLPEWNFTAVGEHKRRLAVDLLKRLRGKFAPGALLHFGQGKWYPGEPVPRWALSCYWRKDAVPVWRNSELIADDQKDYRFTHADAQRYAEALTRNLHIDVSYLRAAYEDPDHYLDQERRLPVNVAAIDSKLANPEDRERLRRVFERGLDQPAGYVLPLARRAGLSGPEWQSGLWMLRAQPLRLIPGDSPAGLRLPLDQLPWVDPEEAPVTYEADPFAPRAGLARPGQLAGGRQSRIEVEMNRPSHAQHLVEQRVEDPDRVPGAGESAPWVVRTALCVEAREGRMHVFLPPTETLEDYFDLLNVLEHTADEVRIPIVLEGYTPPWDPRIESFKVTPDPGVIEVNVMPARNWEELVSTTTTLYDEAHQARLGTEKFMLDGRHTGTGGGNHMVVGGATPADSPFLRRPDLLRSLVGYWINHPSLSYLFSGMFLGPTSQAPRVDEARQDGLYELELAFSQVPPRGIGKVSPWLVDRVFRNLLVDVTGNTHRAEFCIDKLYSPDSASGRLGLLELRAFEMPPHARMSLTQQLLLRALIARFWKEPYEAPLIRWGTRLHDEFMLPFFVQRDFAQVIGDLSTAGYPFQAEWFAPHFEFRYPFYGSVNYLGMELEIRMATEPWHVLGEEATTGGTARYVDSSVERVQVRVTNFVSERYVIACNGRRVPLQNTGTVGEYAGGVRFRAWQPPHCLHPNIEVNAPLVFDIFDGWSGRAVAGCTYHVAHPAGRNYETLPVNSYEAEARRIARFFAIGHTPGPGVAPLAEINHEFPMTLDLRRPNPK